MYLYSLVYTLRGEILFILILDRTQEAYPDDTVVSFSLALKASTISNMAAPASRAIHPCVLSLTDGDRGAEFSTWAYITRSKPSLPNLVTGAGSTITIYSIDESTGKLRVDRSYGKLAGSIVHLSTLSSPSGEDALLAAFAGDPQLTVLRVVDTLLRADSLLDLKPALAEHSYGAVTGAEQDVVITFLQTRTGTSTIACILGGGIAVALVEVSYYKSIQGWLAGEPYILPLSTLSANLPYTLQSSNTNIGQAISTGFGDILSATFLSGYLEPVLVLLHSEPGGRIWPGRLGREKGEGGAPPLYATALSISVSHNRTAALWSLPVSADALFVTSFAKTGCLVVGVNTIIVIESGKIRQVMAVNGWARSTCPVSLQTDLKPNPVVRLAIQLDGSAITWISAQAAVISLRCGQLYVLQRTIIDSWILLPLGQTVGAVGEIAHLNSLSFEDSSWLNKMMNLDSKMNMGLLFAGSRLGDSFLLGYATESVNLPETTIKSEVKEEQEVHNYFVNTIATSDDYDHILTIEENALYASTTGQQALDIVPPSDDDTELVPSRPKRARTAEFTVLRAVIPLDVLVNIGPLGPATEGPIDAAPSFLLERDAAVSNIGVANPIYGAVAKIMPSGFGASGGLAVFTVPGRDDRTILTEEDCLNIDHVINLPLSRMLLLPVSKKAGGGLKVLRLEKISAGGNTEKSTGRGYELTEIDVNELCVQLAGGDDSFFASPVDVFKASLYGACEFSEGYFALFVALPDIDIPRYAVVVLKTDEQGLRIERQFLLREDGEDALSYLTPIVDQKGLSGTEKAFACLWSSGVASVVVISPQGIIYNDFIPTDVGTNHEMEFDGEDSEVKEYYRMNNIVSVDIFNAPQNMFAKEDAVTTGNKRSSEDWATLTVAQLKDALKQRGLRVSGKKADLIQELQNYENRTVDKEPLDLPGLLDDEDDDLYGVRVSNETTGGTNDTVAPDVWIAGRDATFVAICRQSGELAIFLLSAANKQLLCQWTCKNCAQGSVILSQRDDRHNARLPRSHKVRVAEMRFFFCGRSLDDKTSDIPDLILCLALELSSGDFQLYVSHRRHNDESFQLEKVPQSTVARASQEQSRHKMKLARKGMLPKDSIEEEDFSFPNLYRFDGISSQVGLFASLPRPCWVVCERGKPKLVFHRTRHGAPAGGRQRPIAGFCSGILDGKSGFLTLHERVGRIGSQRLTVFQGLSNAFSSHGILPGSGYCVEKVTLGITVRKIQFIDDATISTGNHPLYAMLVSKEIEADQRYLNDDGLTPEERMRIENEKEAAKIKRQVEADLGGFDVESEWVEEIERENCFQIDPKLGGAPPIKKEKYSIWIVDAANQWRVIDSYELGEYEHGMAMEVISLTDFQEDPGITDTDSLSDDEPTSKLFIAVGTGIVDHNGEDVSSKGRALLLEILKPEPTSRIATSVIAELSLCYQKEIFHGPVTTVKCLSTDGRSRLVIGAGADGQ